MTTVVLSVTPVYPNLLTKFSGQTLAVAPVSSITFVSAFCPRLGVETIGISADSILHKVNGVVTGRSVALLRLVVQPDIMAATTISISESPYCHALLFLGLP